MEALTAASVAALTIIDICKKHDTHIAIQDLKVVHKVSAGLKIRAKMALKVGVIVISDRVNAGLSNDEAGKILQNGFNDAGFRADNYKVISNNTDMLIDTVQDWLEDAVELIITTGGNGIGPRDITLSSLEPFFDFRLEGIEQILHSQTQISKNGFYLDRLAAGKIGKTIVICLPLDAEIARDTLNLLIPNIHQAFEF